jgi:hypothetical protein
MVFLPEQQQHAATKISATKLEKMMTGANFHAGPMLREILHVYFFRFFSCIACFTFVSLLCLLTKYVFDNRINFQKNILFY